MHTNGETQAGTQQDVRIQLEAREERHRIVGNELGSGTLLFEPQRIRKQFYHEIMKPFIVSLLGSLLILTLTGCEEMKCSQYSGPQKAWPTGSAFSEAVFDVPVYRGWP